MASNNSAVLDVVVESKEINSLLKESRESDRTSICSSSTVENSLIQSPSLESFSTIQDIENLSELNVDENSDLCVKIDNPQKHLDTLETYITFRITTKVARIEFAENEYIVRRRYNDFLWLRHKLLECHPFCIIPPLPAKHSLMGQLDRYSKDFILMRMKALNIFITRVAQHPILSCNEYFKTFLTAKQGDFTFHRRQKSNSESRLSIISSNSVSSHAALQNRHIEFDKTKSYLNTLSDKLMAIEKISNRINKERQEYLHELNSYHPIFTTWASSEPELASILQSIGYALERTTAAQNTLINSYATTIGNPLKDFLAYIDVVQETLKKRKLYQQVYQNSMEELTKRHNEKDKLVAVSQNPTANSSGFSLWKQSSNDDKLEKLGTYIPQLVKKVEANQDNLECANECLRSDLIRWQQEKQSCIKKFLLDFVNKQIEFYSSSVNAWEHVTNELAPQSNTTK